MASREADQKRFSDEAADWYVRLDDGEVNKVELLRYIRWLEESPSHAKAMEFLQRFCDSVEANGHRLPRSLWRTH